jgi:uncharacterized protein YjbI with pentapeptide repeats
MLSAGAINAYRGTLPFGNSAADQALFCGRGAETEQLTSQIAASPIVLAFSRSGLGKTSLINAGVAPSLRLRGYLPIVARLTGGELDAQRLQPDRDDRVTGDIAGSLLDQIEQSAAAAGAKMEGDRDRGSLWAFFSSTRFLTGGRVARPVLIIDQFEELFSRIATGAKEAIVDQLSDFARNRPPDELRKDAEARIEQAGSEQERQKLIRLAYGEVGHDAKLVLVMREEFLPQLEELKSRIPAIFRTTFRLLPLTPAEAREAIVIPAERVGAFGGRSFSYEPETVDQIVSFLRTKIVNGQELAGDSIEPMQLQMLCSDLERRCAAAKKPSISSSDLGGIKGMRRVIDDYYRRVIESLPRIRRWWNGRRYRLSWSNWGLFNLPRVAARYLCEIQLVTSFGQRNSVQYDVITNEIGVQPVDLVWMVDSYLLRTDARLNTQFYELSHDSLVGALLNRRRTRQKISRISRVFRVAVLSAAVLGSSLYLLQNVVRKYVDQQIIVAPLDSDPKRLAKYIRYAARLSDAPVKLPRFSKIEGEVNSRIDLSGLTTTLPQFLNIDFRNVDFDGSNLRRAIFTESKIEDTSFKRSHLEFSRFGSTTIISSDFSNAFLGRAIFDRAQFLQKVDFSGADVEKASFAHVNTGGANLDFKNSAWWLASGWNLDQIKSLNSSYPPKNYQIPSEKQEEYEGKLAKAPEGSFAKAEALNDFAWMLATRGGNLDDALRFATDALQIVANLALNRDLTQRISSNYKDTLGYILLQKSVEHRAPELLQEAANVLQQAADVDSAGDINFKLAVALFVLGKNDESLKKLNLAMEDGQYRPSHELCLLNEYISGDFLTRLQQLLSKDK